MVSDLAWCVSTSHSERTPKLIRSSRRQLMTAGLVSGQFFLYSIIKKSLGAENGVEIHKD